MSAPNRLTYEYKVLDQPDEKTLNLAGAEGWELISVVYFGEGEQHGNPVDVWQAYMKRVKQELPWI